MRIHLETNRSNRIVPFNYQTHLTSAFHKWLGPNELHGKPALYSFSWLQSREVLSHKSGLSFPNGARWFISAHDPDVIKRLLKGILDDPAIVDGIYVVGATLEEDPVFGQMQMFRAASPIFVKGPAMEEGKKIKFFAFHETESDVCLTKVLHGKLRTAGLPEEGATVRFFRESPGAKTKLIRYDGIDNRVNLCPVIVSGSPEQLAFAWNVGIGHSTGIGFGALE